MFLLVSVASMAEDYYYIQSGNNPETYKGPVIIIITATDGSVWRHWTGATELKSRLLKDNKFYTNAFNNGECNTYGTQVFREFKKQGLWVLFCRLNLDKKRTKCNIYDRYAISLDFKTMIVDPESASLVYYTSVPKEEFIVRKSVDDLLHSF